MKRIIKTSLAALSLAVLSSMTQAKEIVDIAGRTVDIPDNPEHIVLGEGRMIYGVMLATDGNPFEKLAGWRDDLKRADPDTYKKLVEKFPEAEKLPTLGNPYANAVDLEALINTKPDIYILNVGNYDRAKEAGLMDKLKEAGIATVFIDFRQHPLENTVPSMMILGDVFGDKDKVNRFIDYYRKHTGQVYQRVSSLKDDEKKTVFVWRAAGIDPNECCMTFGDANYGRFVAAAGGINWGSSKIKGFGGTVNPEVLFSDPIDLIVATGANWSEGYPESEAVLLGYQETEEGAQKQLQNLVNKEGWDEIPAVKDGQTYAIYHQFYNSPYNFIALEVLGKWMYPERFKDVHPTEEFKAFHKDFLPIDYSGVFWTQLDEKSSGDSAEKGDHASDAKAADGQDDKKDADKK